MDSERLIFELMAQRPAGGEAERPWLAILVPTLAGAEEAWAALGALGDEGSPVALWTDPAATRPSVPPDRWRTLECLPAGPKAVGAFRGVFLPALSPGFVAAIADGDDRDERVRVVLTALFAGLAVAAVTVGVRPGADAWRRAGLGTAKRLWPQEWSGNLWRLRRLGVGLLEGPEAVAGWVRGAATVVGEAQVLASALRGEAVLRVPPRAVVTPLALERARERRVQIRREGEDGPPAPTPGPGRPRS